MTEIERLRQWELVGREWIDKTDWMQSRDAPVRWLGKHRADALREEIERLTAERDELRRQLAEAEQDARRYRWLRENLGKWRIETYQTPEQSMIELHVIGDSCFYSGEAFDRIIDGLARPAEE